MDKIPDVLFKEILCYTEEGKNVNIFDTCREFQEYKEKYFHCMINNKRSIEYYKKVLNNDEIILKGKLHLDLSYCNIIKDVSCLGCVYSLKLSFCKNIKDVSCLGGVNTLNLSHCKNLEDVFCLGNVHRLNLKGCNKDLDISMLSGVKKLIKP